MSKNPSPAEILAARTWAGKTQTEAAEIVYRTLRNWQQWELGERKMDRAVWEFFCIKVGYKI